jgi:hypothetical protein
MMFSSFELAREHDRSSEEGCLYTYDHFQCFGGVLAVEHTRSLPENARIKVTRSKHSLAVRVSG